MSYETLSHYYDMFMSDDYYDDYMQFINDHVKYESILELGCGTGEMSIRFANEGKQVLATDLSSEMLELLQEKAYGLTNLHVACMDMCDFEIDHAFDAVMILTDGINYILDENDVLKVFKNTFRALKDNGTFLFDINSLYKCQMILKDYHEVIDEDDFHFDWRVKTDGKGTIYHHVVIDDQGDHATEKHIQRTLTNDQYHRLLNEAGFKTVDMYSDFGDYHEDCERIIYLCRK
ncbi:MAG: class I SAM-dependent methyltransferase [Erysipelotrichaceae bacterium]|nr:class I SAM-dependent methyltransferase [Erysipelotrichaceae bacterium]